MLFINIDPISRIVRSASAPIFLVPKFDDSQNRLFGKCLGFVLVIF